MEKVMLYPKGEKDVKQAIERMEIEERAQAIGTPYGLQSLFPSNLTRVRARAMRLAAMQRKIMTAKKDDTRKAAQGIAQPTAPDSAQTDATARQTRVGGTGGAPNPQAEEVADTGDQGTPLAADPGPPPQMPRYDGPGSTFGAVDTLTMAATSRDMDAVRAVSTRNEPPQVAQYKANLLQWLEDMEGHDASRAMPDADAGIDPDDDDAAEQRAEAERNRAGGDA